MIKIYGVFIWPTLHSVSNEKEKKDNKNFKNDVMF